MALEFWILLALTGAAAVLAVVTRLRKKRRAETPASENNVYPLW